MSFLSFDVEEHNAWVLSRLPIDLGDGKHRLAWDPFEEGRKDPMWGHRCTYGRKEGLWSLAFIEVTTCDHHALVSREPLHIEPSILCRDCGDHGFIRGGKWEAA